MQNFKSSNGIYPFFLWLTISIYISSFIDFKRCIETRNKLIFFVGFWKHTHFPSQREKARNKWIDIDRELYISLSQLNSMSIYIKTIKMKDSSFFFVLFNRFTDSLSLFSRSISFPLYLSCSHERKNFNTSRHVGSIVYTILNDWNILLSLLFLLVK